MTLEASFYSFWSGFGIDAYPSTNVPDKVKFPYLVYENVYAEAFESASGTVNIYYHTDSEKEPNAKALEIRKAIGSGRQIPYDNGMILIHKGSPEQLNLVNANDNAIKQRQLIVTYSNYAKEI